MSTGTGPPLWLQSLRRRPLVSLLLLVLSAVAVLCATTGPLLLRAVHESSLQSAVADAGPAQTSIAVTGQLHDNTDLNPLAGDVANAFARVDAGPSGALWSAPQFVLTSSSKLTWALAADQRRSRNSQVVGLDDELDAGCGGFVLSSGSCPTASGEALVSAVDAADLGLRTGSSGSAPTIVYSAGLGVSGRLRVVGVYDPDASRPWQLTRPGTVAGELATVTGDPVVTTADQLLAFQLGGGITGWLPLRNGLGVDQEAAARATLTVVQAGALQAEGRQLTVSSQLASVLDSNDQQSGSAAVTMSAVVVQALLVSGFALVLVLQRLARLRAPEWAVGRLRGLPTPRWLLSVWAEPALALLVGAPLGFAGAVTVARLVVTHALRPGTAVVWASWPVWAAAGGTTLVALIALLATSAAVLRRPLVEVIQQDAEPRRLGRTAVVVQAAVVLLAGVAVYQLVAGGALGAGVNGSQLALLAPALLALAAALVAVRVAVLAVRLVSGRAPRSVLGLVVGRRAARTPSSLDPAMVVAAGLAVAIFATQLWQLSVRNQTLRAEAATGAATVLFVKTGAGVDLVDAVRRADPTGRRAMAVRERALSGDGGTSRVVAVDSRRLAAVSPWTTGTFGTDPAGLLHPDHTAPVTLRGHELRVGLRTAILSSSSGGRIGARYQPELTVIVATAERWLRVPLGTFSRGSFRLVEPLDCPDGCRLVGFDVYAPSGADYEVQFTITSLATDTEPASTFAPLLHRPQLWQQGVGQLTDPDTPAGITPVVTDEGLRMTADDPYGDTHLRVEPTDVDDPLPAITVNGLSAEPFPWPAEVVIGTGLDGQTQLLRLVRRVPVLPRALGDGVLVDLTKASELSDPASDESVPEVWLSADTPAGIVPALARQGVRVLSEQHVGTVRRQLLQQAVSRGALMITVVGLAALVVAALAFAGTRTIEAGRRRRDWAALADAGLGPRRLRLLCFVEIAAPGLLAVLLGLASGLVAVATAASRLPLVDPTSAGPPLVLHPDWGWVALLGGAVAVLVLLVAVVGSRLETGARG